MPLDVFNLFLDDDADLESRVSSVNLKINSPEKEEVCESKKDYDREKNKIIDTTEKAFEVVRSISMD